MTRKKKFSFGKIDTIGCGKKINEVTIEVELKNSDTEKPSLSICGEVWNNLHTDIIAGGQCLDYLNEFEELRSNLLFQKLYRFWKLYHLNDMHAGTVEQETAIKSWEEQGNKFDYYAVCEYLKSINLYEVTVDDKPYKYGHAWLYQNIPEEDLQEIRKLLSA